MLLTGLTVHLLNDALNVQVRGITDDDRLTAAVHINNRPGFGKVGVL